MAGNPALLRRARLVALALACAAGSPAAAAGDVAGEGAAAIIAEGEHGRAAARRLAVRVSGSAAAGAAVLLQWSPYPYRSYRTISSAASGADGAVLLRAA